MSFTVKIADAAVVEETLHRLARMRTTPAKSYRLSRVLRAVSEGLKEYHVERLKLVDEFGEKREPTPEEALINGGEPVTFIPRAKAQQFADGMSGIIVEDLMLNCNKIPFEDLEDVSAMEMAVLTPFLKLPEENDGG